MEKRNNILKQIDLKETQRLMFETLCMFSDFCEKHNLKYNLCGGTLLGAIRHQGFIPWDDDLDVCMPRGDYNKFIKLFKRQDNYKLYHNGLLSSYKYPFLKIVNKKTSGYHNLYTDNFGIYIDVFPLDLVKRDDNLFNENKQYLNSLSFFISKKRSFFIHFKDYQKTNKRFVLLRILMHNTKQLIKQTKKILGYRLNLLFKKQLKICEKYKGDDLYISLWAWDGPHYFSRDFFNKQIKVLFINREFNAPEQYDLYLKSRYKDYMKIPSKEEQEQHKHKYYFYYKTKP